MMLNKEHKYNVLALEYQNRGYGNAGKSIDISEIINNKYYVIIFPLICIKEYEDDLWILKCNRYGLHAFSHNLEDAELQLEEEFLVLCDGLLTQNDNNLTKDAITLRDRIKGDINNLMDNKWQNNI